MGTPGGARVRNGRRFRIPAFPFRTFPWFRSAVMQRPAGKLTVLWTGSVSSGRFAEVPRRLWRRVCARWPGATIASMAAQRRPQQERRVPRNSSTATASPCRLPRTAGRAANPPRTAGGLVPVRLLAAVVDLAAGLRGVPAYRAQIAGSVFFYVPYGVIFIASDGRRCLARNSAVYVGAFCGSEEEGCRAPFQGCAEAGYRAKQDVHKTALCIDRARSIHKLIPVPRPCREFPTGILRRRHTAGLARKLKAAGSVTWLASSMTRRAAVRRRGHAVRGSRPGVIVVWGSR
jgi:hypothetical protein